MSLSILQNVTAMSPNGLTTGFSATGGTAPYTFSVLPGGAGGTINSSTGVYTSPSGTGVDTILVTDSLSNTAQTTILIGNAVELLCDIIQTGMGLSQGQVYLWDQKLNKGMDFSLYVAVAVLSPKVFGSTIAYDGNGNEIQSLNVQATVSIDIYSRGPEARDQKELVVLALSSQYAEQQMEANSFRIYPLSKSFTNLSQVDGAAIPYRYNILVGLEYFVSQTTGVSYFSTIPVPQIVPNP